MYRAPIGQVGQTGGVKRKLTITDCKILTKGYPQVHTDIQKWNKIKREKKKPHLPSLMVTITLSRYSNS